MGNRHQHLIVRAEVAKPPRPDECEDIERWMAQLIHDIDMKILAEPRARYCDVVGNRGMTADALLETSNTVLHSWDECSPAIVQFDLYTCSCLPLDTVFRALERFEPTKMEYKFLDREHGLVIVSESGTHNLLDTIRLMARRIVRAFKTLLGR